jgi:hypothetical protein
MASELPEWTPREYQAFGFMPDSLQCVVCGYVVPRDIRDDCLVPGHPFHHPQCFWYDLPDKSTRMASLHRLLGITVDPEEVS